MSAMWTALAALGNVILDAVVEWFGRILKAER
jgi:hypothetical protein